MQVHWEDLVFPLMTQIVSDIDEKLQVMGKKHSFCRKIELLRRIFKNSNHFEDAKVDLINLESKSFLNAF